MFTGLHSIAKVETSFAIIEFFGPGGRVQVNKLDHFSVQLGKLYQPGSFGYHFGINLREGTLIDEHNQGDLATELVDAFEALLMTPELVRHSGRLQYMGNTTRRQLKNRLAVLLPLKTPATVG